MISLDAQVINRLNVYVDFPAAEVIPGYFIGLCLVCSLFLCNLDLKMSHFTVAECLAESAPGHVSQTICIGEAETKLILTLSVPFPPSLLLTLLLLNRPCWLVAHI